VFSIASDEQLEAIVLLMPGSKSDFYRVPGMRDSFISRYANEFLRILRSGPSIQTEERFEKISDAARTTLTFLPKVNSFERLTNLRGLEAGIVASHLQEALENGAELSRETLVPDNVYYPVLSIVRRKPNAFLKDIRAELGGTIDYALLRVATAFARKEKDTA
jgi:uncharacterized protein YpbB